MSQVKNYSTRKYLVAHILGSLFGLLGIGYILTGRNRKGISISILSVILFYGLIILPLILYNFYQIQREYSYSYYEINFFTILRLLSDLVFYPVITYLFFFFITLLDIHNITKEQSPVYIQKKLFAGRLITITMLIFLPTIFFITFISSSGIYYDEFDPASNIFYNIIIGIRLGILYLIFGFYVTFPITYSTEVFFKRMGYENAIQEFGILKKILLIATPLAFLTIFYTPLIQSAVQDEYFQSYSVSLENVFANIFDAEFSPDSVFSTTLVLIISATLSRMLFYIGRKDFRFYFAKSIFFLTSRKILEVDRAKLLQRGLKSYDIFLRRHMGLHADTKKILLNLNLLSLEKKNGIIGSLYRNFEEDRLAALKFLSSSLNIPIAEELLIKEKIIEKVREWAGLIALIIPLIISIITLVLPNLKDLPFK